MSPGYEKVRDVFMRHFEDSIEDCAQCCVYVDGHKVVDLWGRAGDTSAAVPWRHSYDNGSVQNIFSSTKVLTSLVVAMLVDRGHITSYDQLVTDIWPEFGQNGKSETTIAHVMRHEAGLSNLSESLRAGDLTAASLTAAAATTVSETIAKQKPAYAPGAKRTYHSLTRGWIINEIVRRADPAGRTIGQFLAQEVAAPLGLSQELMIGLPGTHGQEQRQAGFDWERRIAPLRALPVDFTLKQLLLPRALGGGRVPVSFLPVRVGILMAYPAIMFYGAARRALVGSTTATAASGGRTKGGGGGGGGGVPLVLGHSKPSHDEHRGVATDEGGGGGGGGEDEESKESTNTATSPSSARQAEAARRRALRDRDLPMPSGFKPMDSVVRLFNSPQVRRSECPSANGHASARALATVAAAIVQGGTLIPEETAGALGGGAAAVAAAAAAGGSGGGGKSSGGASLNGSGAVQLLSPRGVAEAHDGVNRKTMFWTKFDFDNAGWCHWGGKRMGYIGWMGLGGSVMQWHPDHKIGFGYCANVLEPSPMNERGAALQRAALECAKAVATGAAPLGGKL